MSSISRSFPQRLTHSTHTAHTHTLMLAASTALPFLLVLALVPLEIAEGEAVRSTPPAAITIACVGDSITFGVCSSSPSHSYPGQLQLLLDAAHGTGTYAVSNLGSSGATMLKHGDQPYWDRGEFGKLTAAGKHWDVVLIMLGTNDAKDSGDAGNHSWHGNWQHDCGGPTHTTTHGCAFAEDYASMIGIVNSTKIYALVPPPIFGATPASQMCVFVVGVGKELCVFVYVRVGWLTVHRVQCAQRLCCLCRAK